MILTLLIGEFFIGDCNADRDSDVEFGCNREENNETGK